LSTFLFRFMFFLARLRHTVLRVLRFRFFLVFILWTMSVLSLDEQENKLWNGKWFQIYILDSSISSKL
jgi:hypothetical protein